MKYKVIILQIKFEISSVPKLSGLMPKTNSECWKWNIKLSFSDYFENIAHLLHFSDIYSLHLWHNYQQYIVCIWNKCIKEIEMKFYLMYVWKRKKKVRKLIFSRNIFFVLSDICIKVIHKAFPNLFRRKLNTLCLFCF